VTDEEINLAKIVGDKGERIRRKKRKV